MQLGQVVTTVGEAGVQVGQGVTTVGEVGVQVGQVLTTVGDTGVQVGQGLTTVEGVVVVQSQTQGVRSDDPLKSPVRRDPGFEEQGHGVTDPGTVAEHGQGEVPEGVGVAWAVPVGAAAGQR